jgi:hypothetical protein
MKFIGLILIASLASLVSSAEEQHLVFGFDVAIDGASGDPMSAFTFSNRLLLMPTLPPTRATTYISSHFSKVSPGAVSMLCVTTSSLIPRSSHHSSYTGDNSCRRCDPLVSSAHLGKRELLETIRTTDAFEAKLPIVPPSARLPTIPSLGSVTTEPTSLVVLQMPICETTKWRCVCSSDTVRQRRRRYQT